MVLLPRRTYFALCAFIAGSATFLLMAAAAQHGRGPLAGLARHVAARRALADLDGHPAVRNDQGAIDAYVTIANALKTGSLAKVPENAARIAEAFGEINPDIAASARRLARSHDLEAARREFQRLTGLFSRRPGEPDEDEDSNGDEDDPPDAPTLEV